MKQQLVRLLYPYGSTRTVLTGPARGMRFVVEPGMGFSYAMGTEAAAPRQFARWIHRGMTVYDVGANKGQMALLFAALAGPTGRVVAFEPAPAEFSSLVRNLSLNALETVRPLRAAAAACSGSLAFAYSTDNPTQGKLSDVEPTYETAGTSSFSVETLPLDDVAATERPPDVIKVDVEGAAASVFRGAIQILEQFSPALFVELHGPEEQAGVRDEVLTRGYVAETITGDMVDDPTNGWFSPLWCYKPGHRAR